MSKKIVHSTDVGPTLGGGLTTLDVKFVNPDTQGVVYADDRGMFTELKGGKRRINTAYYEDISNGEIRTLAVLGRHNNNADFTFEEMQDIIDQAVAGNYNKIVFQKDLQAFNLVLNKDGFWESSAYKDSPVFTLLKGLVRTVNDLSNPLFVEVNNSNVTPTDPTGDINMWGYTPLKYLRCVDGATALIELITPMKIRSVDIVGLASMSGYVQHPLEMSITYHDDTMITGTIYAGNASWSGSEIIDQTKAIKSFRLKYRADKVVGVPSLLKLTANGTQVSFGMPDFNTLVGDYVQYINYVGIVHHDSFNHKFYPEPASLVDITNQFTLAISGATLNPIFPISTLTDNDQTTFTNTTPSSATSATFTATKTATSKAKPLFVDITFGGLPNSGNLTLQSIVTVINNLASNTNIISNTRWFRNTPNDFTVRILINAAYTNPYLADRISIALTKTSTTQPFSLSEIRIFGVN